MPLSDALRAELTRLVTEKPVVLFMKGDRGRPACGFSASVVAILDELLPAYETVDVLRDAALRDGIKELSDWPTLPQLYIHGKFVGGADIVKELYASGELAALLGASMAVSAPSITLTDGAATALRAALADAQGDVLHFEVSPRFEHGLFFGPPEPGSIVVDASGVSLHLDRASARRADGVRIDFVDGPAGGFKIDNPSAPPQVKELTPAALQAMLASGEPLVLVDVRTEAEMAIAALPGAERLDQALFERLLEAPKDRRVVLYCHHGVRSRSAAAQLAGHGLRDVYNLRGGIDAWSLEVDPSVPRY